ncbi:hypothetical protein VTJ04DRAFT_9262 [Mycothermus thermophilus]|uniref:uncharacterized protein n=1 Tax=Humicola insolens TaxID=85995 RepID=UPI0037431C53
MESPSALHSCSAAALGSSFPASRLSSLLNKGANPHRSIPPFSPLQFSLRPAKPSQPRPIPLSSVPGSLSLPFCNLDNLCRDSTSRSGKRAKKEEEISKGKKRFGKTTQRRQRRRSHSFPRISPAHQLRRTPAHPDANQQRYSTSPTRRSGSWESPRPKLLLSQHSHHRKLACNFSLLPSFRILSTSNFPASKSTVDPRARRFRSFSNLHRVDRPIAHVPNPASDGVCCGPLLLGVIALVAESVCRAFRHGREFFLVEQCGPAGSNFD